MINEDSNELTSSQKMQTVWITQEAAIVVGEYKDCIGFDAKDVSAEVRFSTHLV